MATAGLGAKKRRIGMITEINVTPLVDIMLVLLIIFMLTTDIVSSRRKALELDLPAAAIEGATVQAPPLVVQIARDGALAIDGAPVDEAALTTRVEALLARDPKARAVIAADRDTAHGRVVWVMSFVKRLGLEAFAIEIDPKTLLPPPGGRP